MSTDHGHGQGAHGHTDGQVDEVDYGKVIGVGIASLAIFAASIFWAGKLMGGKIAETQALTGKAREFDTHRAEIGIVDQTPFSIDRRMPEWRAARKAELESYGWVDKSKGVVRIPIEAAMDKVVGGAMPPGAPR